jgi:H+-translocating NAD(P) transhydrogenase
MVSFVN